MNRGLKQHAKADGLDVKDFPTTQAPMNRGLKQGMMR